MTSAFCLFKITENTKKPETGDSFRPESHKTTVNCELPYTRGDQTPEVIALRSDKIPMKTGS